MIRLQEQHEKDYLLRKLTENVEKVDAKGNTSVLIHKTKPVTPHNTNWDLADERADGASVRGQPFSRHNQEFAVALQSKAFGDNYNESTDARATGNDVSKLNDLSLFLLLNNEIFAI